MEKAALQKQLSDNIGRNFNLVFNQVSMYNVQHKSGLSAIDRFYDSLKDGLKLVSPPAVSLSQEQVFVEEEPLDQQINTSRMATHFKKVGIESISFESHLGKKDLILFLEVITDLNRYATIDAMKTVFDKKGLTSIRINYVIYRKITEDEEVVHRSQIDGGEPGQKDSKKPDRGKDSAVAGVLDVMVANIVSEEIGENFSIKKLMDGPGELSDLLISSDLAAVTHPEAANLTPGSSLASGLKHFNQEINDAMATQADLDMADLAKGVIELKNKLLEGIEEQKAKGVVYVNEPEIRRHADEITDNVLVQLITEEYGKGAVSVKRLAGIVIRLVPETEELKRILPKVKQSLLNAGMPLADFLLLVQELKNELQSDELSRALEKGADAIGLDGEDLAKEIMENPGQAAELICLAAEIRKSGDDEGVLSELLVDYVERIGTDLAVEEVEQSGQVDSENIQNVFSRIRTDLVDNLKTRQIDAGVFEDIEKRLTERMDESIRQLKSRMVFKQVSTEDARDLTKDSVLKMLQSYSEDEEELNEIMGQVKQALADKGIETQHFQQIYNDMMTDMEKRQKEGPNRAAPAGTLNRKSALFVLENEIKRASRYDTPFSTLSFSIVKAVPQQPVKAGKITIDDVIRSLMIQLVDIVRETDIVGLLGPKMVMVLQPMTDGENSKIALERISSSLKKREFEVKEIPFDIQFAGVATPFDHERTSTLKALVQATQQDLKTLVTRLSNLRSLM